MAEDVVNEHIAGPEQEESVTSSTDSTAALPTEATPGADAGEPQVGGAPAQRPASDGGTGAQAAGGTPGAQLSQQEIRLLRDELHGRGFDVSPYGSDDEALEDIIQRAHQHRQIQAQYQQLNDAYQQLAWQQQQARAQAQQAQQAQQQQPAQQQAQDWGWEKPPEWDPEWERQITVDEQGRIVAAPGSMPGILQKRAEYNRYLNRQLHKFAQDPLKVLAPGIKQMLDERDKRVQALEERLEREKTQSFVTSYVNQNLQHMLQFDANGQPKRQVGTGYYAYSPYGQAFMYHLDEAKQLGFAGDQAIKWAERGARAAVADQWLAQQQQQPAQQPAAQPAAPTKPKNGIARALRNPSHSGTEAAARGSSGVAQNDQLDFGKDLSNRLLGQYGSWEAVDAILNQQQ